MPQNNNNIWKNIQKNYQLDQDIRTTSDITFNKLTLNDTTDSTSKDTGSLILEGGLGIEKSLYLGGDIGMDFKNIRMLRSDASLGGYISPSATGGAAGFAGVRMGHGRGAKQYELEVSSGFFFKETYFGPSTPLSVDFDSADFEVPLTIDNTATEALLVRKDSDGGDVFTVDTTNDDVTVNANLNLTSTTSALTLHKLTSTQRDALTPVTGMLIFNTTTSKYQGYFDSGGGEAWGDLH